MNRRRSRGLSIVAALLALALVAAACADDGDDGEGAGGATTTEEGEIREGGTVTVGAEQFPAVLNTFLPEGNTLWTSITVGPALARGYRYTPDLGYEPWLFEDDCAIESEDPFTVRCKVRGEAVWSDGTKLTAEDFKFTWETIMNPANLVTARDGYDKITQFNVVDETTFDMVFSEVYAPFRELWSSSSAATLPKHVLEGKDFNTVWNDCVCNPDTRQPIGSGPFLVTGFTPNQELTLTKNDTYWDKKAHLDTIVFKPFLDTDAEVNAFRAGEVDLIYPQNQIGLREKIEAAPGASFQATLGAQWEHFDMRTDVPGLDDIEVRKAIATAMPRRALTDRLLGDTIDDAEVLNNVMWMTNQEQYEPHWDIYPEEGDVEAAIEILEEAGYTKGSDGIYAKDGQRLSFTVGVTAGNQARELAEQIIIEQMKKIGVELRADNSEDMLTDRLPNFQYETIIFAWVGGPDPSTGNTIWRHDTIPQSAEDTTGQNYTKVQVPEVTDLIKKTDLEADAEERADLYNQADKLLAEKGVSSIPLFQKPTIVGFNGDKMGGVRDNPTEDSITWNIEEWFLKA